MEREGEGREGGREREREMYIERGREGEGDETLTIPLIQQT